MEQKKTEVKTSTKEAQPSLVNQAENVIRAAGSKGITARDLATKMKLIDDKMNSGDRSVALKKVRTLARKASGGPATKREGRSAIYTLAK